MDTAAPMSLLSRFLNPPPPPLAPLWAWITATARQPHWYLDHGVADSIDGRFDMVALVTALVMLELEQRDLRAETALLTERFVEDMDGSLRDIGIGDMVIGKHMGRVVGALGGRLGAYRAALAPTAAPGLLPDALARNVYRGDAGSRAEPLAAAVRALAARITATPTDRLIAGEVQ